VVAARGLYLNRRVDCNIHYSVGKWLASTAKAEIHNPLSSLPHSEEGWRRGCSSESKLKYLKASPIEGKSKSLVQTHTTNRFFLSERYSTRRRTSDRVGDCDNEVLVNSSNGQTIL
jgi:hypothetical protein